MSENTFRWWVLFLLYCIALGSCDDDPITINSPSIEVELSKLRTVIEQKP